MKIALEKAKEHLGTKQNILGVEIGVWAGENALDILNTWQEIKTLHLVDNYSWAGWEQYGDARVILEPHKSKIWWQEKQRP